jgi:hypothetical protein
LKGEHPTAWHRQYRDPHAADGRAHHAITKPAANTVLSDAVNSLVNCPSGEHSNFEDAVAIIRKELIPRISEVA